MTLTSLVHQASNTQGAPRLLRATLAACCATLWIVACGSASTPPAVPDLPADVWQRDAAPIITAGARGDDGLIDIAVADPDVVYDEATGVWHHFQNREPLVFTNHAGQRSKLKSFGIRPEDEYAYFELRRQPAILFVARDEGHKMTECVIDLDRTSQPNQIILALVEPKPMLAETVAAVEERIETTTKHDGLGPNDVLLVPEMAWHIAHRFAELEGQALFNSVWIEVEPSSSRKQRPICCPFRRTTFSIAPSSSIPKFGPN